MEDLTDREHPADAVRAMVDRVLELASSWTAWDGQPIEVAVDGEAPRVYTPHKAVRRVADHMVDHLAQIEARLARSPTIPDGWHASAITTAADLAPFTTEDLDEACSRLGRLRQIYDVRLRSLDEAVLDEAVPGEWTIREIAAHLGESVFYAESMGRL